MLKYSVGETTLNEEIINVKTVNVCMIVIIMQFLKTEIHNFYV